MADGKIYNMINRSNGARIQCTQEYLTEWLARGFEIESIDQGNSGNLVAGVNTDATN